MMVSRLNSFLYVLIAMVFSFCGSSSESKIGNALKTPNVLLIMVDDLRPELGCYGSRQVRSPHIDALASSGIRFDRAYCNVPVCGASRASLLTGILPTRTRFVDYQSRADKDVPFVKTLPEVFKKAGYQTISNGKVFHHVGDTDSASWSESAWRPATGVMASYDPETTLRKSERGRGRIFESPDVADSSYADGKIAEKTIADLKRLKEGGAPFFLACGFVRPHLPFYAPEKYWDLYDREQIEVASNRFRIGEQPSLLASSQEFRSYTFGGYEPESEPFHRMMRHGYFASTSYVDKLIGDVLRELESLDLADHTIVVLIGDHGWHLGEHEFWGKHNTLHNAIHAPLIVRAPGRCRGSSSRALVQFVDLFPTLCDLAGIGIPSSVQGKSFERLLDTPHIRFNELVYTRFKKMDAIVEQDFTYSLFENGEEMLFDLRKDPGENVNRAGDPAYNSVLERLRLELADQMILARSVSGK